MLRFGVISGYAATIMALGAFAVASVSGLLAGHPAQSVLSSSIVSMIICFFLGAVIGAAFETIANERTEQYVRDHPVPEVPRPQRHVEESDSVEILEDSAA